MAKRKRLDPARLDPDPATDGPAGLETKSMFPSYPDGVWQPPRRAPIATVAGEASATAALGELAETLAAARRDGRLVQALPLDAVDETYLVRDRMAIDAGEMAALTRSLAARGQQSPIEVADLGQGRYGLISGWRRLTALRALAAAGQGPDRVLAIARPPQDAADAYLAMVEENEIRAGLSYYERARIVARATDKGVFRADRVALAALFVSASRPRRSKIGAFVRIVRALDDVLRFPAALPERAGLALAQALETRPELAETLVSALAAAAPDSAEAEARAIARALATTAPTAAPPRTDPAPSDAATEELRPGLTCTETAGRLTLSGPALDAPGFRASLRDWLRGGA